MIGSYPEFDVENETAFELEGRILSAALSTDSPKQRRALAREFVAVRRGRHHRLSGEFANFDQMSEMNEGLAEYALERALQFLAVEGPPEWRATAVKQAAANRQMKQDRLDRPFVTGRHQSAFVGTADEPVGSKSWRT